MRAKRWVIASPDTERVRVLSRETGYTPLTAAVLSARGIDTPQAAADYLSCDVRGLHDPFGLTDMDKAVEVVREVIDRGEKMVVYGDYDVDGITATCTLVDYLRSKGAKCEYYIPNRLTDGYGLTRPAMEQLYEQGTRLLITVDSGITANEEISVARELGMQGRHYRPPRVATKTCRTRRRSWTASGRTIPTVFQPGGVGVAQADLRTRGRHAFRARPVRRPCSARHGGRCHADCR